MSLKWPLLYSLAGSLTTKLIVAQEGKLEPNTSSSQYVASKYRKKDDAQKEEILLTKNLKHGNGKLKTLLC